MSTALIPVSTFIEKTQNLILRGDLNSTNMFDKFLYDGKFLINSPIVENLSASDPRYLFEGGISQFRSLIPQAFFDGKPTNVDYIIPKIGVDIIPKTINAYVMLAKTTLFTESVLCNNFIELMGKDNISMKKAVIKGLSYRIMQNLDTMLVNMLKGIGEITTISNGNTTTDYVSAGIETTLNLKKNRVGMNDFMIIMSFNTLQRILSVENALKVATPTYVKTVEPNFSGSRLDKSISNWSDYGKVDYIWKNSVRISTYNGLTDGNIYIIEPGAFHYKPYYMGTELEPLVIDEKKSADGGLGTKALIAKFGCMIHPNGFTFDGKLKETAGTATPTYDTGFGLSPAELALANMYKLLVPVEYSPILVYKIKPV